MRRIIVLLLVVVMVISGCANDNEDIELVDTEKSADPNVAPGHTAKPAIKEGDLRQISMLYNNPGCSTEDRYYRRGSHDNCYKYHNHTCYVDYTAKQQKYMCDDPNCTHDSIKCPAYIGDISEFSTSIFFTDDKSIFILNGNQGEYWIDNNGDGVVDSEPLLSHPVLYRMNLDGTDRSIVYDFGENTLVDEKVFFEGKNLIMLLNGVTPVDVKDGLVNCEVTSTKIIQLSLADFSCENIMDVDTGCKAVGCTNNILVLAKEKYKSQYTYEKIRDDEDMKQRAKETSTVDIYRVDINEKTQKPIKTIDEVGIKTYVVARGSLYYAVGQTCKINIVDINTGIDKPFVETKCDSIVGQTDENLICETSAKYMGQPQVLINLDNGSQQDVSLHMSNGAAIKIIGGNSIYYLVESDTDGLGNPQYALIIKEDFNNQEGDLIDISMLNQENNDQVLL